MRRHRVPVAPVAQWRLWPFASAPTRGQVRVLRPRLFRDADLSLRRQAHLSPDRRRKGRSGSRVTSTPSGICSSVPAPPRRGARRDPGRIPARPGRPGRRGLPFGAAAPSPDPRLDKAGRGAVSIRSPARRAPRPGRREATPLPRCPSGYARSFSSRAGPIEHGAGRSRCGVAPRDRANSITRVYSLSVLRIFRNLTGCPMIE